MNFKGNPEKLEILILFYRDVTIAPSFLGIHFHRSVVCLTSIE